MKISTIVTLNNYGYFFFLRHGKIRTREFLKASPFQVFPKLICISGERLHDVGDAPDLRRN